MVEPIRELLDAGMQSDRDDADDRWLCSLRDELFTAEVELACTLTETDVAVGDLSRLQVGDVIPVELPEYVVAVTDEVPLFRASFGVSRGNLALKVVDFIEHGPASSRLPDPLPDRDEQGLPDTAMIRGESNDEVQGLSHAR